MRVIDRNFSMVDGQERYISSGEILQSGISLAMQYSGTGYDPKLRITGDGGSTVYTVCELTETSNEFVKGKIQWINK